MLVTYCKKIMYIVVLIEWQYRGNTMELMIDNVLNIASDEFYRASRYKMLLSVILINSSDSKAFNVLYKNIRQSDIVQQLSSDMIVVILTHTDYNNALLFIKNVEQAFDFTYTLGEFKEDAFQFIRKLFLDNKKYGDY